MIHLFLRGKYVKHVNLLSEIFFLRVAVFTRMIRCAFSKYSKLIINRIILCIVS